MHTTDAAGQLLRSSCDFCGRDWLPDGDQIMIEGHQGSLICTKCLSAAYRAIVLEQLGADLRGGKCRMCLESRQQPLWQSPVDAEALCCLRCMKQAATALEKDPETGWTRPGGTHVTPRDAGPDPDGDEDDE